MQVNIGTTGTQTSVLIAKAVTTPDPTVTTDVSHGCLIKAVYLSIDGCGLAGSGVLNSMFMYIYKNPGDNLTAPNPFNVGSSNEKKFVFREWSFMVMRNQDGNLPFHWEGWIRIPKRYHRMGTDDTLRLEVINTASATGHFKLEAIYKWYR